MTSITRRKISPLESRIGQKTSGPVQLSRVNWGKHLMRRGTAARMRVSALFFVISKEIPP